MSEQLAVIDVPAIRPPGVTPRQWRLAALLPRCESAAEAMRQAGYALVTVDRNGRRAVGSAGVQRAKDAQDAALRDKARGINSLAAKAFGLAEDRLKELEVRDLLSFGLNGVKVASEIGESVVATGSGTDWKIRLRRAMRLAYRFGYNKGRIPPPTTRNPKGIE